MIFKEWRDARWKLVLGALAFLVVAVVAPRSYGQILVNVERDVSSMKDVEYMREPGYPAKLAGGELEQLQRHANHAILVPLAGLFGVALVSAEVGQGSIFLLLSRPLGRRRVLLTKYAVCAACLFAVALVGAVGMILSAYVRGYPPEAVNVGRIFVVATLFWLGALFVLGVSLLASVIFGNVILTILAAAGTVYLVYAGPDIVQSIVEGIFWTNSDYAQTWRERIAWTDAFDRWRLSNYWGGYYTLDRNATMAQSFLVCLFTAVPPLLLALWLFRRKAY